ncbi:MAG: hypothetical protein LBG84_09730 [Treponema sp.]|jgi:YD repeat-containing protein|nr:hypothetical protein [Treponema sp.]
MSFSPGKTRFAALAALVVAAYPVRAQQGALPAPRAVPAAAAVPADSSGGAAGVRSPYLQDLLEAAAGKDTAWRPDWPLAVPPDLFAAPGAASIRVEFEDGTRLELIGTGGKPAAFPVLIPGGGALSGEGGPEEAGGSAASVFVQGRAEYDSQGRLVKLRWANPPGAAPEPAETGGAAPGPVSPASAGGPPAGAGPSPAAAPEEDSDAETLAWDDENRPLLVRVFAGDYYFAALEYAGPSVFETWYSRDGQVQADKLGPPETRYDYNGAALVSRVVSAWGEFSALYNKRGMPLYLELIPAASSPVPPVSAAAPPADVPSAAVPAPPAPAAYRYQWDEAGRLVRFSGGPADSPVERRYEYTLDDRGNWTERREITMTGTGGRLVPAGTTAIRRVIGYGVN